MRARWATPCCSSVPKCTLSTLAYCSCFFFNDTATTEIYTLSLHDALPILANDKETYGGGLSRIFVQQAKTAGFTVTGKDRKSTRLNSSHSQISYAVFCLKKKKPHETTVPTTHAQRYTPALRHSKNIYVDTC